MSVLTSGFMEAQCDVSVEAQTEVVVEDVDGELKGSSRMKLTVRSSSGGRRLSRVGVKLTLSVWCSSRSSGRASGFASTFRFHRSSCTMLPSSTCERIFVIGSSV